MSHGNGLTAWTWTCSMNMDMQHGHRHAAWTWTRTSSIFVHGHGHAHAQAHAAWAIPMLGGVMTPAKHALPVSLTSVRTILAVSMTTLSNLTASVNYTGVACFDGPEGAVWQKTEI
jgi:hypothetical protein